jgi:hypothetical protein
MVDYYLMREKIRIKNIVFSGNITENKPAIIFLLYLVNLYMQNYESLIINKTKIIEEIQIKYFKLSL